MIASLILGLLAAFVWFVQLATVSDLSGGDAAGNGLSQAFAGFEIIILWLLLGALVLIAGVKGRVSMPVVLPALVALPASGVAALAVLGLLAHPADPPYLWPMIVSAAVPPLVLLFCVWAIVPMARQSVPSWFVAASVWGATVLLSTTIWPFQQIRNSVIRQEAAEQANWAADFEKLPRDAPLWDWTPFLDTPNEDRQAAVIQGIQYLPRRQDEAETMLDRGDFPLLYLRRFDLTPDQTICDKTRALLRRQVAPLMPLPGQTKPYAVIRRQVISAVAAMQWLVGYGCGCDAESEQWEAMATAYRDPEYEVYDLKRVRDPRELGRVLREHPARFSMLSPKSHLKGWLSFVGDKDLHDQALAGARSVETRAADAVEILGGSEYDAWDLLVYLPDLDLRATPELCAAALREAHRELAAIYRPTDTDPRPYRELLDRMGTGKPLEALIWLTSHGCETSTETAEAETLLRAYQDSPNRAAMLRQLRP